MSELVCRLRALSEHLWMADGLYECESADVAKAADELEAQTALIAELVEAIEGLTCEKMNGPDSYELWHKATSALSKANLATTAEKSV